MMMRATFSVTALTAALVAVPASGQLFSDAEGDMSKWDTGVTTGLTDIRFGFDYGNFDIFGDGYTTGSIVEAPRSAGGTAATTGIFITVNHDSIAQGGINNGQSAAAAVFAKNLDLGAGTATPNFKMTFDVFHSTATGWDYGGGDVQNTGTTNYMTAGALFENTDLTIGLQNPGAPTQPGGISLATTGEGGTSNDWYTIIDGKRYSDEPPFDPTGTLYLGVETGLATGHIVNAFQDAGFTLDANVLDNILNSSSSTPIPGNEAAYDAADPATYNEFWREQFPRHSDPLHYQSQNSPGSPSGNDTTPDGAVSNRWVTHEVSVVDNVFYYSIDGTPVTQLAINDDPNDPDRTIYDDIDAAGTIMLGFWDAFNSISDDPEGANFVVYDNVVVEALASGAAPFDMTAFLEAQGYIPAAAGGIDGDYNDSGLVEQGDLDQVLSNWGAGFAGIPASWINQRPTSGIVDQAELDVVLTQWGSSSGPDFGGATVPEPATLALACLGGLALLRRRA